MSSGSLFDKVVHVTYIYLGPAADRFVSRQITNHLDKKPQELNRRDLVGLVDWLRVAMSFLTEDQAIVRDYTDQLEALHATPAEDANTRPPAHKKKKRPRTTHANAS